MTDPHPLPVAGARHQDQPDTTPADDDLPDHRDDASRVASIRDPKHLSAAGESKYVPAASPDPAAPHGAQPDTVPAHRKRPTATVRVLPAHVAPMSDEDRQQAVTALANLIASWWQQHDPDPDA
jgi:hypothetical protein